MTQEKTNSGKEAPVVNSFTEWELLEEVIVSNPENAFVSFWDPVDKLVYSTTELAEIEQYLKLYQPYPQTYVEAASQAMDRFIHILEAEGVIVRRIEEVEHEREFATPDWKTTGGFCATNPRDPFLIIGDQIIEAPMSSRSRYFEARAYRSLFKEYAKNGARWVSAPKPLLLDELYNPDYAAADSSTPYVLTEFEPVFDAADFVRCGRDIIGQLSHVTNQSGVDWLQHHLGDDYQIHLIQSLDPKPAHIDTTLMPLAPDKVLVNPSFTDVNKLPEFFKTWEVLIAPEPVPYKTRPRMMSDWISINTLMLDEQRIVVEERQEPLIRALKQWGFHPIPCAFEDYYPFIGGFHCATLDIRRRGELQSYCFR
ncbi:MAG TPA: amidinotransferase [Thioploca sp.]|nr:MAG: amidinotransferase [Beggiatoa sp. 4572_84]RKZ47300.1 MAG: amidinotransferase [Gammaproteobacteria bacterium]HDN25520.1 amidinotransferase [Thioploca sp.]